jgi:hypothetical protein
MSEDIYLGGRKFYEKWFMPRPMTEESRVQYARRKDEEALENILQKLDEISEFVNELDESGAGGEFVSRLRRNLDQLEKFKRAAQLGVEAAKAARDVEADLMAYYKTAYSRCRQESGGDDDTYFICVAGVDRRWQSVNTDWVLNKNRDNSWVNRTFERWRGKVLEWISP